MQDHATQKKLKWQSLRSFNITIIVLFVFLLSTGLGQSYTGISSSPAFLTGFITPLIILLLSIASLIFIIYNKHKMVCVTLPLTCLSMTLFIAVNSHLQEHAYVASSLHLLLLFPVLYTYLFAYNLKHLMVNNVFLIICYTVASAVGETDAFTFLSNIAFLITILYLTVFSTFNHNNPYKKVADSKSKKAAILSPQNARYLNRIIHDIRQPLSSLSLYGHLLENKLAETPHYVLAKNIKTASEELERWLSNLLDLARLDEHLITANLTDFILSSALLPTINKYQSQAAALNIQLTTHLTDVSVKTDQRLLTEIVDTLLKNAIVHGDQQVNSKILISIRSFQGKVLLQVWNQGKPIEPSIYKHLFDEISLADNPLHNKNKGIGLGLSIAQRKAKLCNTRIDALSHRCGARFSIPLDRSNIFLDNPESNKTTSEPDTKRILLIDDDKSILNALCMLLENWGYLVDCAESAENGLAKYETTHYDLVISDYRLPNQKTGIDVIKAMKKQRNTPAVLLTGEVDLGKLERGIEDPNIRYKILNKPVKPAALRFLLIQLLT
jgi:signal transduction histidine kinase/CheY-like chemotaxis protein